MGERPIQAPGFEELVTELLLIRRKGITELRFLELPAWRQACRSARLVDEDQNIDAPQVEALLRRGVEALGGGRIGECAGLLFGLEPGTRGDSPTQLRKDASERWGISEARFRRDPQTKICHQIVDAVLLYIEEQHTRQAHLNLERRLAPTSRLAIAWLERFESYYRIWSSATGIASDLCAYRSTLLEPDRPYDSPPGTDGPDDPGYTQELQASGYITESLWYYTEYLVALQQFVNRHGGLWLLSDAKAEEEVAHAIYRITWHSPNSQRDDSYLRELFDRANGELHQFRCILESERVAGSLEQSWHQWAEGCQCVWNTDDEVEQEHYPTHRHHPGIDKNCQLHAVVAACNDYTTLIDDDWRRIADWYRLGEKPSVVVNDRRLYDEWRGTMEHRE